MVILAVVDPNRAPTPEDGAVLRHAVRDAREQLRQVERGVGVVTDPEEEHLPVQLVHPTDGTFEDVRREREWAGGDLRCLRAGRRKRERVVASCYPGQPPEQIRDDAEVR